jgi:hypothetical protein
MIYHIQELIDELVDELYKRSDNAINLHTGMHTGSNSIKDAADAYVKLHDHFRKSLVEVAEQSRIYEKSRALGVISRAENINKAIENL